MRVLAFDFGASTGRAMLGEIKDGRIIYKEINRFDNVPYTKDGHMYWNFDNLWGNVKESIRMAGDIDSIGIDTWGVDFGIIDSEGRLKSDPVHYRDARTIKSYEDVTAKISEDELYSMTGIQVMRINTMFQLVAAKEEGLIEEGDRILFMPDLFAYMLTGRVAAEYTIATTSGLIDKESKEWNIPLIRRLGLCENIFPPIIKNGEIYGTLSEELCKELGITNKVNVTAVCTHDTASAIAAMVAPPETSIFISSGTWSLMGIERESAFTGDKRFTNEGGYGSSVTYLSNIMGLWLMQEMRRCLSAEYGRKVSFKEMDDMMAGTEEGKFVVDTNDERFVAPTNMKEALNSYVKEHYGCGFASDGEIVRCIYDSLAKTYADVALALNEMHGGKYDTINILGGGSKATPLAARTAKLTGLKIVTGPSEATAVGNMIVQFIAGGEVKDIKEAREIISKSEEVGIFA